MDNPKNKPKIRQLTDEEKKLTKSGIKQVEDDLEYLMFNLEMIELHINKGALLNYKKTLRESKSKLREIKQQAAIQVNNIKAMNDQLRNGVQVKEKKEENK